MKTIKFSIFLILLFVQLHVFAQNPVISGQFTNLCPGVSYTYTWSPSTSCARTDWVVNGGTKSDESLTSVKVVWFNTANGTISAQTNGNVSTNTCPSQNDSKSVTIRFLPAPTFTGANPLYIPCGATSITLSVSAVPNATSYVWTLPNGITAPTVPNLTTTGPSITVTLTATANGQVTVKAVDNSTGCNNNGPVSTLTITRTPADVVSISKNSSQNEMCVGDAYTYTVTLPSGVPANYGIDWVATNGLLVNGVSATDASPLRTTSTSVTVTSLRCIWHSNY